MSRPMPPALDHPWADGPAEGTTRAVLPGLRWVRMAVNFPPEHINLWLIEDGAGWAIVDCGLALDETRAAWQRIFANDLGGRPITRVLVTHFHPDHIGLADWLTTRWSTDLWMTRGEWLAARAAHPEATDADLDAKQDFYRSNGVPVARLAAFRTPPNQYFRRMVPAIPARFRRIEAGAPLRIGAQDWQVRIGRGHAPEHACLWCPALNVLIGGDMLLPRISPNVSVWASEPASDPLAEFLDSLAGFADLPADVLVLPAHGQPFRGLHVRIAALVAHHAGQLDRLAAALAEGPRDAVGCFPLLFRREIGAHNMGLALGEAVAHLHRLVGQGRARRVPGADGVARFHTV